MTLKQKKFLEELPKNNYNISKTAKNVGYSDYTATSSIYGLIRNSKNLKEYFTEESVRRDIKRIKKLTLKKEDYTNYIRATELESKILGLQIDKSQITQNNPDKITIVYGNKSPTETTSPNT